MEGFVYKDVKMMLPEGYLQHSEVLELTGMTEEQLQDVISNELFPASINMIFPVWNLEDVERFNKSPFGGKHDD